MATMLSKTRENFRIEGTKIEAVSFFDLHVEAYDVSNLSEATIEALMNADDVEEFAEENNIKRIELEQLIDSQYGTDMYVPEVQSETKAVIFDVDGSYLYEGGVREYAEDFDEIFAGIEYLDGGNYRYIWENDDLYIEEDSDD